jgi:hypothetical protein
MLESRRQQQSRLRIEHMLLEINTHSANIAYSREKRYEYKQNLMEFLSSHGFFVKAISGQINQFTILNLVQLFVYILDFIVSSAVCEYMARTANLSIRETQISRYIVPAMIIGIEVAIDAIRQYYYGRTADKVEDRVISILFHFISILMTVAMPGLYVGTSLAARYGDPTPLPDIVFYIILGSLGILTFAGHCIMLFSHMAGFEAKSYIFFLLIRRKLRSRFYRYETSVQNMERWLISNFQSYCNMINQHNKQFDDELKHGPFTEVAREIINDLFGYEIIPSPRDDDDGGPDDGGGGGGGSPSYVGSDETRHHDDPGRKSDSKKEASTDDDPIFAPSRAEWDPFKK